MPWPGTEYLKVAPRHPGQVAVVGDRIIACNSTAATPNGTGHFSTLHVPSGAEHLYDGLGQITRGVCSNGTYAFSLNATGSNNRALRRIDPGTGVVTTVRTNVNSNNAPIVAVDATTLSWAGAVYDIPTDTLTATALGGSAGRSLFAELGRLFHTNGADIVEVNPSTGTTIGTTAGVGGIGGISKWPRIGDRVYFRRTGATGGASWFDLSTGAIGFDTSSPPGMPVEGDWIAVGSTLYSYIASNDTLTAFDPATGNWVNDSLSTSRAERTAPAVYASNLWFPAGYPV